MKTSFFLLLFGGLVVLAACTPLASQKVSLRMKGAGPARDASVTVDDQYIGALAFVAARGVALPPGTHRITVDKPGYFPWDRLVEAKDPSQPIHLDVVLVKVPD